jgi:trk system potassium uptake protein TrkA
MKQFAVLGLGQFGSRIAAELAARDQEVVAIDSDEAAVAAIKGRVAHAVCADVTDEDAMSQIGLEDVEAAVVAIGEDQLATILATAVLRSIGVTRIIARSVSPTQQRILKRIGANEVLSPEDEIGRQVAERLITPGFAEVIALASDRRIVEMRVITDWVGRTIGELDFRRRHGATILGIKRPRTVIADTGESTTEVELNDMPGPGDRLEEDDVIMLIGPDEAIAELRKLGG